MCFDPDIMAALRHEIEAATADSAATGKCRYDSLPLLDSFMRESARMNPLDMRKH